VTGADLHYEGSIAIGPELIEAAGFLHHEKVDIYNVTNGERFSTYVIPGTNRGEILVNGAAARLVQPGDQLIICAFGELEMEEAKRHQPRVVLVDEENRPLAAAATAAEPDAETDPVSAG